MCCHFLIFQGEKVTSFDSSPSDPLWFSKSLMTFPLTLHHTQSGPTQLTIHEILRQADFISSYLAGLVSDQV